MIPAAVGLAMEVPLFLVPPSPVRAATEVMSEPGAVRSGLRRSWPPCRVGPRDEEPEIQPVFSSTNAVNHFLRVTETVVSSARAALRRSPSTLRTITDGIVTVSPSQFIFGGMPASWFTTIAAIAPASCAAVTFSQYLHSPRSMTAMWPATASALTRAPQPRGGSARTRSPVRASSVRSGPKLERRAR